MARFCATQMNIIKGQRFYNTTYTMNTIVRPLYSALYTYNRTIEASLMPFQTCCYQQRRRRHQQRRWERRRRADRAREQTPGDGASIYTRHNATCASLPIHLSNCRRTPLHARSPFVAHRTCILAGEICVAESAANCHRLQTGSCKSEPKNRHQYGP